MYVTFLELRKLEKEPCGCGHIFALDEPIWRQTRLGAWERVCPDCGEVWEAEVVANAN